VLAWRVPRRLSCLLPWRACLSLEDARHPRPQHRDAI